MINQKYLKYINDKDYLIIERGLSDSTFTNRYNLLRRTLIKLYGNNSSLINDIKIIKNKENKGFIYILKGEKDNYLISLYKENEISMKY